MCFAGLVEVRNDEVRATLWTHRFVIFNLRQASVIIRSTAN